MPTMFTRRFARSVISLGLTLCLMSCADLPVGRAIRIGTASVSHTLCSNHFIGGQPAQTVFREEMAPDNGIRLLAWALKYRVDETRREVTTTVAGGFKKRAVFRDGLGCTVLHDNAAAPILAAHEIPPRLPELEDGFAPPEPVTATDSNIRAAIDAAFVEPAQPPYQRTKAVVVVHRGQVIGEGYAPGISLGTPLHGHSITKSVVHALAGVLTRDSRLRPFEAQQIKAWQAPDDPRHTITIDQLLGMVSGLPADEYSGGWDASSRMWFAERDMTAFAATASPNAEPGTRWAYSDLGLMLVSRALRDAAGGNAAGFLAMSHRELFGPIGMRHVTFEFDVTGTPLGPSHMYASARDWARFGLLYLNDGVAGGKRILPEGWVKNASTPKTAAAYGSGFWLNNHQKANSLCGLFGMTGAPTDAYFARGYLGQYVVIVPSRQLVVVRLGVSHGRCGQIDNVGTLVKAVVQSLDAQPATAQSTP